MILENYWKMLISLVVTLGLAVVSLIVARKMKLVPSAEGKLLKIVESARLDQRSSVFIVEVGSERFLVGTSTPGGSMTMTRIASAASVESVE